MHESYTSGLSHTSLLRILQYVVLSSVILYFGQDIFIPVSFALLISFVLYPICLWMEKKGIGRLWAIVIAITLMIIVGLLILALFIYQLFSFLNEWPALLLKLEQSIQDLSRMLIEVFGVSLERQQQWISKVSNQSGTNIFAFIQSAIKGSAYSAVLLVLIPVYSVLILFYRTHWMKILHRVFPSEKTESLREIISLTIQAYYNFIKGMAVVYLTVGILNSIGLLLIGVPHAILFGFIASILTFIPYVGIMVGSMLPITIAWITYDSIWYPVGVVALFAFIQYLEANVIFPIAVSSRLNVNTLAMLISIFAGGIIWGMAGMILFVPFVGIAKLIADHNPKLKTMSMILGMNSK